MAIVRGYGRGMGVVAVPTPQLTALANAIQQQEGYIAPNTQYPSGSLAYQNNNPGNLVYVGQAGATQGANGFAYFPTYQAGYQALMNQLQLDANNGLTVAQEAAKWCPASVSGCNVPAYTNTMATSMGVDPNTTLADAFQGSTGGGGTVDATGTTTTTNPTTTGTTDATMFNIDLTDPTTLAILAIGAAVAIQYL